MTLDLAMATWRPDALLRLDPERLPRVDGVRYVISWQQHGDAPVPPEIAARADIEVVRTDASGLSANRNNALEHCRADIILNADDDMAYSPDGLRALVRTFEDHPEADLIMCAYADADGRPAKPYPAAGLDISRRMPRGLWCGTVELAFRRRGALNDLRFEPLIGPGTEPITSGEDEYFLLGARRRGAVCRFEPVVIGRHTETPHAARTTLPDGQLRSFGFYIAAAYPRTARARILLKALRLSRLHQAGLRRAISQMAAGRSFYRENFRQTQKNR